MVGYYHSCFLFRDHVYHHDAESKVVSLMVCCWPGSIHQSGCFVPQPDCCLKIVDRTALAFVLRTCAVSLHDPERPAPSLLLMLLPELQHRLRLLKIRLCAQVLGSRDLLHLEGEVSGRSDPFAKEGLARL